jgi:hypothetical protein
VLLPGGDVVQFWLPGDDQDDAGSSYDLFVCEEHAAQLGQLDVDDPYVIVDVELAEGWRLVIEFMKSPGANPLVLYPPSEENGERVMGMAEHTQSSWKGIEGADHTSGVMRCEHTTIGGHVHCRVFGPFSGKAGDLVFRTDEWDHFRRTHPQWQFTDFGDLQNG